MVKLVVAVVFTTLLKFGKMELPVNAYLPSYKSTQIFTKTYAPPTHNVSFNFGYPTRMTKDQSFMDTSISGYDSHKSTPLSDTMQLPRKSSGPIENNDHSLLMTQLLYNKHGYNSVNNFSSPKATDFTSNPSLSAYRLHSRLNNLDSVHKKYSGEKYTQATTGQIPSQIEENTFSKKLKEHDTLQSSYVTLPSDQAMKSTKDIIQDNIPSVINHESNSLQQDTASRYDFSYEVMSPETGVNHGHRESFDGKTAEGVYHNLLPDGRLLTVEYSADESGFKPRISYKLLSPTDDHNKYGPY